jgi:hypothetical protein
MHARADHAPPDIVHGICDRSVWVSLREKINDDDDGATGSMVGFLLMLSIMKVAEFDADADVDFDTVGDL